MTERELRRFLVVSITLGLLSFAASMVAGFAALGVIG